MPSRLTLRQRQVLALACAGRSNKEIARLLGISVQTVRRHLDRVYEALGARGRSHAAVLALSHGDLTFDEVDRAAGIVAPVRSKRQVRLDRVMREKAAGIRPFQRRS